MKRTFKTIALFTAALFIAGNLFAQQTRAFNQNASRSNHSRLSLQMHESLLKAMDGQNNNTVRSNRGELKTVTIWTDTDGDGTYETDITANAKAGFITAEEAITIINAIKAGATSIRVKVRHETAKNSISNMR